MKTEQKTNVQFSAELVKNLSAQGVRLFCVCAGARNAPIVEVLSKTKGIEVLNFFDERSAAFFALGRCQANSKPVVVVTTSGTAVAELLPAVVEAHYSGQPLILLTADRPKGFRGTASPQTIEQPGIFANYSLETWDLSATDGYSKEEFLLQIKKMQSLRRPLHINVCFDEPLLDAEAVELVLGLEPKTEKVKASPTSENIDFLGQRPLVVLGPMNREEAKIVKAFLLKWQGPVFAEFSSQLSGDLDLEPYLLNASEPYLSSYLAEKKFDSIIRIGGVPTLKLWRDLDRQLGFVAVLSLARMPFSGLARQKQAACSLNFENLNQLLLNNKWQSMKSDLTFLKQKDLFNKTQVLSLLEKHPLSEPNWFSLLAQKKSQYARVFVGNSLPIREWDLVDIDSNNLPSTPEVFVNRGVNGIDGLISSFFGVCEKDLSSLCVLGDLSALYDLNALWINQYLADSKWTLVVVNNGGGMIFKKMFNNRAFENNHSLRFKAWAEMFQVSYNQYSSFEDLQKLKRTSLPYGIVEILPSAQESDKFWTELDLLKMESGTV